MGGVSMLDVSLLVNELLALFLLSSFMSWDPREGLNMHAQFSFYTSVLLALFKTLSIPCLFLDTQRAPFLKETSILKENLIKLRTLQSPVQMILVPSTYFNSLWPVIIDQGSPLLFPVILVIPGY